MKNVKYLVELWNESDWCDDAIAVFDEEKDAELYIKKLEEEAKSEGFNCSVKITTIKYNPIY